MGTVVTRSSPSSRGMFTRALPLPHSLLRTPGDSPLPPEVLLAVRQRRERTERYGQGRPRRVGKEDLLGAVAARMRPIGRADLATFPSAKIERTRFRFAETVTSDRLQLVLGNGRQL